MKERIYQLLAEDQTEEALGILANHAKGQNYQEVVLLKAWYERLKRSNRLYLAANGELSVAHNQLNDAILQLTEKVFREASASTDTDYQGAPTRRYWLWGGAALACGLLLFVVFQNEALRKGALFPFSLGASNTVKILVEGIPKEASLGLPEQGLVNLIHGNTRVSEPINAEGEAIFTELPDGFFTTERGVVIQFKDATGRAYRTLAPDSFYLLKREGEVKLVLAPLVIERIFGVVQDSLQQEPLAGVVVRVGKAHRESQADGRFALSLPLEQQAARLVIHAERKGYQTWKRQVDWKTTAEEITIRMQPKKERTPPGNSDSGTADPVNTLEKRIRTLEYKLAEVKQRYDAGELEINRYINLSSTYQIELDNLYAQRK